MTIHSPARTRGPWTAPQRGPGDRAAGARADLPIAFLGSYAPRLCGIASFTQDLAAAAALDPGVAPVVIALTDPEAEYAYPPEVRYEVRQSVKADYARAAELVNFSDVKLVSVQHEFGIYGGEDGSYVLDFLAALRVPAVATLHTVLASPSARQRKIVQLMARSCAGLVVMSDVAAELLERVHGVAGPRVHRIAHGIPELPPRDPSRLKLAFGVEGRRMLLTFGLIGPGKGIETVLRALPAVVRRFPDVVYFVIGATHPTILAREGEAYRTMLEREAEALGVREHVVFRNQFVTPSELGDYLQAADVFVSPYLAEAQVTSGALSHAMGAGLAIVSTPYWHAREILAGERGRLFPSGDHAELARVLVELLASPPELARLAAASRAFARDLTWPRIAAAHVALARSLVASTPRLPDIPAVARPTALPELRLDHLLRMTDDTGIVQHASHSVPARRSGYCVDDNARALIVALRADHLERSRDTRRLVTTYLAYLHHSQREDGAFDNFMSYARTFDRGGSLSDDCLGRAAWALGVTVRLAGDDGCRQLARAMLRRAQGRMLDLG